MATRKSPSKSSAPRKRTSSTSRSTRSATTTTRRVTAKPAAREVVKSEPAPKNVEAKVAEAVTSPAGFYNRFPVAALIAEFLGTFIFVSFAVVTQVNPLYAFFGLIAIVVLFSRLSGPHLNPAITIGAWLARFVSGRTAVFYILAQILGGLAAFGVLTLLTGGATTTDAYTGATTAASLYSLSELAANKEWYIFAAELIGSIILGYAVATALTRNNSLVRGFLYGGGFLLASFIAYASGAFAIMNPVLAGALQGYSHIDWSTFNLFPVLVYVIAPVVGASLGFGLYKLIDKSTVTE